MSARLVKAHGGSRTLESPEGGGSLSLGGLVMRTTKNSPEDVHMKNLSRLVANTTGVPKMSPMMDGVIASTVPTHMKDVPEFHKVPASEVGKTKSKRLGQVPYAGKKY